MDPEEIRANAWKRGNAFKDSKVRENSAFHKKSEEKEHECQKVSNTILHYMNNFLLNGRNILLTDSYNILLYYMNKSTIGDKNERS